MDLIVDGGDEIGAVFGVDIGLVIVGHWTVFAVLCTENLARGARKRGVVLILEPVKTAITATEADYMAGERAEGIDAGVFLRKIDHLRERVVTILFLVFQNEFAHEGCRFFFHTLFDGAVTVAALGSLCVNEIVFHAENAGKPLGDEDSGFFVHAAGVDENALRGVIRGEDDAVSVHDRTARGGDGRFIDHLLQNEFLVVFVFHDLQINESADDDCRKKGADGEDEEGACTHLAGGSAEKGAWLFAVISVVFFIVHILCTFLSILSLYRITYFFLIFNRNMAPSVFYKEIAGRAACYPSLAPENKKGQYLSISSFY